jgi:signal transduction histidine kinase/ActR/RegA family two-component response regulator
MKVTIATVLAMAACLLAVHQSASRFAGSRRQELENETRVTALEMATRLGGALEQHKVALQQMANFLQDSRGATLSEFDHIASATFAMTPRCLQLMFIDRSFRIARVFPRDANEFLLGLDMRTNAPYYEAIIAAIEDRRAFLSPPMTLIGGQRGFTLTVPASREGRYLGAVIGAFRGDDFFAGVLLPRALQRYEMKALGSGSPVFSSRTFEGTDPSSPTVVEGFVVAGSRWEVQVRPRTDVALSFLRAGQATLWTFGWLLALATGAVAGITTSLIVARLESQGAALQETRAQLDGAMQQLIQAEKLTALGELVAGVAHEINNPLSAVMGWTQLLLSRDPSPEFRRRLETMYSEEERMGKIVKNLLTFARKHPPEKKYLGLNGIIEKTLELKAYHFKVNQIRVDRDLQPDLPMTMLDFHQMQQVLLNLFNNAEQAMVESGRGGTLRITTRRVEDSIEASVTDDGPGIPEEVRGRVFEPFFTTKKEGKGTGLGLSLCYGIVQEHAGTIAVDSQVGTGTTFTIRLPIVQAPSVAAASAAPEASPDVPRLRLLVVDDEESILNFLIDLLSARGHHLDTASDVPEALRKLATGNHDVIISDMKMPRGTGRDVYDAAAKRDPRLARRIVFTTGDAASAETLDFIHEIGNEVVFKPFKIDQLEKAIARAARN